MGLKELGYWNHFDLVGFCAKKSVRFVRAESWKDYDTKEVLGTKVLTQIMRDDTQYKKEETSNNGEQMTVKVPGVTPEKFSNLTPYESEMKFDKVIKATVYGEYNNQLSIEATFAETK